MACTIDHLVRESVAILDENRTVQEAVALMADHNVGSLVVTRNDQVVGLFTERDLVKRVVAPHKDAGSLKLGEVAAITAATKQSPTVSMDAEITITSDSELAGEIVLLTETAPDSAECR